MQGTQPYAIAVHSDGKLMVHCGDAYFYHGEMGKAVATAGIPE